ncbi:hypothetical protein [Pseudomonas brassicacearum]|uniref:hypothetical protein n=1 Tax=Pseudomonas TaxID=286 RepID=UPI002E1406CF
MNPPIGAIKDRLIGGFGGKRKSQTSITDSGIKKRVDWEVTASRRMISVCCNRSKNRLQMPLVNHLNDDDFDSETAPTITVMMSLQAKSLRNEQPPLLPERTHHTTVFGSREPLQHPTALLPAQRHAENEAKYSGLR